jgi:hypothetical protein
MIEIKPKLYNNFVCPECNSNSITISDIIFTGLHISADNTCNKCNFEFIADFPIGHSLFHPVIIGKNNRKIYGKNYKWFHKPFLQAYMNKNNREINLSKKVYKEYKEVIILNCVDYLYGHVLLKLFNAQYYLENYPELGLIVIIPENFKWLVPAGIAEVWSVDIKLSEAREWFVNLDKSIKKELERFKKIFLSLAYSHPDFSKIDISNFTKVSKFNLNNFGKVPITLTFISREDRFWVGSKIELYIFFAFRKLKMLRFTRFYFVLRQNHKISSLFRKIKRKLPDTKFYDVGLGNSGKLASFIEDKRTNHVTEKIEEDWCKIYSQSHIVIGIHGSNMILPSALAGGVIEILPELRLNNITQDIAADYKGNMLLYMCRFVNEFSTPREIANNALSMIKSFKYFFLNSNREGCKKVLNNFPNNYNL